MKTLVIVLNIDEYLEDILTILANNKVKGATIIDSQGMGSAIVTNEISSIPLFSSLKMLLSERHPRNKTIFSVIHNDEILNNVVLEIQELLKKDDHQGIGFMFTVPVDNIFLIKNGN